ncbi:MAG: AAA family ATPase [Thermoleophilia bacterium]
MTAGPTLPAGAALLERERELGAIRDAVRATAAGQAGLVLVEGPAGIGKSRLLGEARRLAAAEGLVVLSARGGEIEREFPYGVVRQLLEARLVDADVRDRCCTGAASRATSVFDLGAADDPGEAAEGSFAALHALYWLVVNLSAEAPLLLAVDDLHWCDRPSLRFLAYLARRLDDLPVLLVASLRPSEPGADQALLAELRSDPLCQALLPGPLTGEAAALLVHERLGDAAEPAFAAACHAATQGNPLLLSELLKAVVAEGVRPDAASAPVVAELGPRAASRAVLLRLSRLSADAVAVARALAVLGDGAELGLLGTLAGVDPGAVAAATRDLVRAEIVRPEPPLGFVHPLVQAAVYRDLSPGERELLHEQAARHLVAAGAPAEQVAAHLVAMPARGEAWVVDVLRAAATAALRRGAPEIAASALQRASAEPPAPEERPALLLELGRVESMVSVSASAVHLREAYDSLSDPVARGLAADGLARALMFSGLPDDATGLTAEARAALGDAAPELAGRLEAIELCALFFGAVDRAGLLERIRGYRSIDAGRDAGARMLATIASWEWTLSAGPVEQVVGLARAALGGGALLGVDSGLMSVIASLPLVLADLDEGADRFDEIRADAHRTGNVFTISGAQLWGGFTLLMRGDLVEAEADLRASLDTLALWGVPGPAAWSSGYLAEVLVERGSLAEARAVLGEVVPPPESSDMAMIVDRATLGLLLAEGRAEEALRHSERAAERAGWKRHPRYATWRTHRALALDRLGRTDEAAAVAAEQLEIARDWGSPGTVGLALRVLGTIEREDGIPRLEQACDLLADAPARLERARALAALGMALRRARRPADAREPLRAALELAEICGARPLVDELRAEIYATGARPRTTALHGVASLTASERRVAELAAGGQSNRDIAQTLYVTPKTVEVHLSNAYRKLGIRSRRDLGRALEPA